MSKLTRALFLVLFLPVSSGAFANDRELANESSTAALNSQEFADFVPTAGPPAGENFLDKNKIAVGTILKSHHFDKDRYDYHDYNENHDGVYFNINRWSTGTFINSADERSLFLTYNPNIYRKHSFAVNMVTGIANGYEGWENAQGDYLLILGLSAQWSILKTMVTPETATFGLEIPLN